ESLCCGREPRVGPRRVSHLMEERSPFVVVPDGDCDPAVVTGARERTVGCGFGRTVSEPPGRDSGRALLRDRGAEGVDGAFDLGQVQVYPSARPATVDERAGDRGGGEAWRERVGDRSVGAERLAVRPAGQV